MSSVDLFIFKVAIEHASLRWFCIDYGHVSERGLIHNKLGIDFGNHVYVIDELIHKNKPSENFENNLGFFNHFHPDDVFFPL